MTRGACNFIKKETLAQVFSCEFFEIFKNTFFYRTSPVAASVRKTVVIKIVVNFPKSVISESKLTSRITSLREKGWGIKREDRKGSSQTERWINYWHVLSGVRVTKNVTVHLCRIFSINCIVISFWFEIMRLIK